MVPRTVAAGGIACCGGIVFCGGGGGGWLIGGVRGEEGKEGGMVFLSFAPDFC